NTAPRTINYHGVGSAARTSLTLDRNCSGRSRGRRQLPTSRQAATRELASTSQTHRGSIDHDAASGAGSHGLVEMMPPSATMTVGAVIEMVPAFPLLPKMLLLSTRLPDEI